MTLNDVIALLKEGKTLWGVRLYYHNYSGSLVDGHTYHFLIKPGSRPNINLKFKDNLALGIVEEVEHLFEHHVVTARWDKPWSVSGYSYYITDEPCWGWARHRGNTGDRCDDEDWFVESVPIRSVEELDQFLRVLDETPRIKIEDK
jgi:hypothetical protein